MIKLESHTNTCLSQIKILSNFYVRTWAKAITLPSAFAKKLPPTSTKINASQQNALTRIRDCPSYGWLTGGDIFLFLKVEPMRFRPPTDSLINLAFSMVANLNRFCGIWYAWVSWNHIKRHSNKLLDHGRHHNTITTVWKSVPFGGSAIAPNPNRSVIPLGSRVICHCSPHRAT